MASPESFAELGDLGLVNTAGVDIRVHSWAPLFKLYLINAIEVFFGFYPVREHQVEIDGQSVAIFDPMGKDTELFHHALDAEPDSLGTRSSG